MQKESGLLVRRSTRHRNKAHAKKYWNHSDRGCSEVLRRAMDSGTSSLVSSQRERIKTFGLRDQAVLDLVWLCRTLSQTNTPTD